ncbi:putative immunity protein [Microbacterium sp. NPDC056057]|uniref:putative immunity protein n=1 Tax=Microbacterium sp. NPDC056057 TaxID=3345699 RepID=UPI0035D603B6
MIGTLCEIAGMLSPQSLSEDDRRRVAAWAAGCAERVLPLFESEAPDDDRPRDAIARARGFAAGQLSAADEIRQRFIAGRAAKSAVSPAGAAAARAAAQAAGVAHMGAHALGAAAYAARAVRLSAGDPNAVNEELEWQIACMSSDAAAALRSLPPIGTDSAGPLGPGLLSSGDLGEHIRLLQARLHATTA